MKKIAITTKQLTASFAKWEHEFRTEQKKFESRAKSLKRSARSHGGRLTETLLSYIPKSCVC